MIRKTFAAVAVAGLWPQTLFGLAVTLPMMVYAPVLILWSLPLLVGFWVAIPFSVLSSDPALGAWLARKGVCTLPEELMEPQELRDIHG